jgi:hypothetical protein
MKTITLNDDGLLPICSISELRATRSLASSALERKDFEAYHKFSLLIEAYEKKSAIATHKAFYSKP